MTKLSVRCVFAASGWLMMLSPCIGEEVVIEGDPELLELLRTAQLTSEAQFTRGRLVAEIHDEWRTGLHSHSVVDVTWEGENTYFDAEFHLELVHDLSQQDFFDVNDAIEEAEKEFLDERLIAIETPGMKCRYKVDRQDADIEFHTGRLSLWPIYYARPDQLWLGSFRRQDVPWSRVFNSKHPRTSGRFKIAMMGDNDVLLERFVKGRKSSEVVCSLPMGGRVIRAKRWIKPEPERNVLAREESAVFRWEQLPGGFWIVREMEETHTYPDISDAPLLRFTAKVLEYDPDPEIPADRFEVQGLHLPPGTQVSERRGNPPNTEYKYYQIGGQGDIPQELLDRLAEELSNDGFGNNSDNE